MGSKNLTAKLSFNTLDAERKLSKVANQIKSIDKAVNNMGSKSTFNTKITSLTKNIDKLSTKASSATKEVNNLAKATKKVSTEAKKFDSAGSKFGSGLLSSLGKIAGLLIGVTGAMSAFDYIKNTSDTITSAKNKINYTNGNNQVATQDALDKMFTASINSRSNYGDMMSNVGKSMTLAGDAFGNNINNAIRFQEIMAKSYAIGGASAAEQASSMYQLVQALGAGVLQGDELRSVTEGAPIAAKAIEKYAQEVNNTTLSLKEMGSQGMITSDMVVKAMLNASDNIDKAFENTDMTIAQVFTRLRSVATKAFKPLQEKINEFINSDRGEKLIAGIEKSINSVAMALEHVLDFAISIYDFFSNNWSIIEPILWGIVAALGVVLAYQSAMAVMSAIQFVITYWQLAVIAAVLGIIIGLIIYIYNTTGSLTQALAISLGVIGAVILAIGIITGNVFMIVAGAILALAGLFFWLGGKLTGAITGAVSVVWNILVTKFLTMWEIVLTQITGAIDNFANFFGNILNAPCTTIVRTVENMAVGVLNVLQTIANGIDSIFGTNLANGVQNWINKVHGFADTVVEKYASEADKALIGENSKYETKSKLTAELHDFMQNAQNKFLWDTSDAYKTGYDWGEGVKNKVEYFGNNLKSKLDTGKSIQEYASMVNAIDTGNFDFNTPGAGITDIPSIGKGVGNIDENTGKIKDSMELTEEDLKYLRQVAEMEWKKEYTTAAITVDMSNYNTINGEGDLDGIVTKLADKLYEEMDYLANGTYA